MSVRLLTSPGCPKSKRIRNWFKERDLEFQETNLNVLLLEDRKLIEFLRTYDPKLYCDWQKNPALFEKGKEIQLARWLQASPSRIRRPVVILDDAFLSDESLCSQLEESITVYGMQNCAGTCSNFSLCAGSREDRRFAILTDRKKSE